MIHDILFVICDIMLYSTISYHIIRHNVTSYSSKRAFRTQVAAVEAVAFESRSGSATSSAPLRFLDSFGELEEELLVPGPSLFDISIHPYRRRLPGH